MSAEADIFAALAPLVDQRVYPATFVQVDGAPQWPAIRYTLVGGDTATDSCGDGDESTDALRYQIDVVATTADACAALRQQVRAALKTVPTPMAMDGAWVQGFDSETRTHRATADFTWHGSG